MNYSWVDLQPDEILQAGDRVFSEPLGKWVLIRAGDWRVGKSEAGAWLPAQRRVKTEDKINYAR